MSGKQTKLTTFLTKKSNETPSGMRKHRKINMNVLVNVNLKSRFGKRDAKTFYIVSAVPSTQPSSITPELHPSTSTADCAESGTTSSQDDSTAVNINVTLNVTADTDGAGK